jgi:hypothetical protein
LYLTCIKFYYLYLLLLYVNGSWFAIFMLLRVMNHLFRMKV